MRGKRFHPANHLHVTRPRPQVAGRGRYGFTLLELSIVIAIIATITAAGVSAGVSMIDSAKRTATRNTLDVIEQALMAFRLTNNRLPCPADETLAPTNAYFGYEAGTLSGSSWEPDMGVCTTAGTYTTTTNGSYTGGVLTSTTAGSVAANYNVLIPKGANNTNIAFNTYVAEGGVPVKALNLPAQFAFDAYGNHIAYAVWAPDTAENAFLTYSISPSCGAITVNDAGGNHRSQSAVYALASYGPDGNGAYPKSGGTTRTNGGIINTDEQTNCHCTGSGADNAGYAATYVLKEPMLDPSDTKHPFQQQVRYKDRWQMYTYDDAWNTTGSPCIPGFIIPGSNSYDALGGTISAINDFTQDGKVDMVIAPTSGDFHIPGNLYVMFGKTGVFDNPTLTTTFTGSGSNGFKITGLGGNAAIATAVGDVNGDSYNDLIIAVGGDYDNPTWSNTIYVIYGQPSTYSWPAAISVNSIGTTVSGAVIKLPETDTDNNVSLALADINGDGKKDVIVGFNEYAGTNPSNGTSQAGAVYAILGRNDNAGWQTGTYAAPYAVTNPASPGVSNLDGSNGFVINGTVATEYLGSSGAAGDLNGDGIDDIVIGRNHPWGHYVILGQHLGIPYSSGSGDTSHNWASPFDLTTLTGSNGFAITHPAAGCWSGNQTFVDLNGDTIKDLVIGNSCTDPSHDNAIVLWGQKLGTTWSSNWPATINIESPPANYMTTINENAVSWGDNIIVGTVGDVNGDGVADLVISAPTATANGNANAGVAWVLYGHTGAWASSLNLSTDATGTNDFEITGCLAGGNIGGIGGITGGDITNDGYSEIMLSAPTATYNSNSKAGINYVIYGRKKFTYNATLHPLSLCDLN